MARRFVALCRWLRTDALCSIAGHAPKPGVWFPLSLARHGVTLRDPTEWRREIRCARCRLLLHYETVHNVTKPPKDDAA